MPPLSVPHMQTCVPSSSSWVEEHDATGQDTSNSAHHDETSQDQEVAGREKQESVVPIVIPRPPSDVRQAIAAMCCRHFPATEERLDKARAVAEAFEVRENLIANGLNDKKEECVLVTIPHKVLPCIPVYFSHERSLHNGELLRVLEVDVTSCCQQDEFQIVSFYVPGLIKRLCVQNLEIKCRKMFHSQIQPTCAVKTLASTLLPEGACLLRKVKLRTTAKTVLPFIFRFPILSKVTEIHVEHLLPLNHFVNGENHGFGQGYVFPHFMPPINWSKLPQLVEVHLINCGDYHIQSIPRLLASFGTVNVMNAHQVLQLGDCPNLRKLDLVIERGAEINLPSCLTKLRWLSLFWDAYKCFPGFTMHYKVNEDALLRVITNNRDLSHLQLNHAALSSDFVEHVLRMMGPKLIHLSFSIFHQGEAPGARLSKMVDMILRYNPNLETLAIAQGSFTELIGMELLLDHMSRDCIPNSCVFCDIRHKLSCLTRILYRRLPYFRVESLERLQALLSGHVGVLTDPIES